MLVLSSSGTHNLNGYMVGCGCHEILIERSITILFLKNFSLSPIQLWFQWLSYSNHSFQLISIQYSVHHSAPAENVILAIINHSFRLSIEGRLTYRVISPVVIRAKPVNLLHRSCTESTHQRNRKRSLFRKDHRIIYLTRANTEGMSPWLWHPSISISKLIQRSYSGSNPISYPLPSLVQDTMCYCHALIVIPDPVFECKRATNLFQWKLVDRWIRWGSFLRLDELREGKCFHSGRNWLDERLETYLICVSYMHGWISLLTGFDYFTWKQTGECERFGADAKRLAIQQMRTRFALEIIVLQNRVNQIIDSVYSSVFLSERWSAR